jgi:single-stranded-DNA-specific exonuclease
MRSGFRRLLSTACAAPRTYLPHRDEGYGLSSATVHRFSCSGTELLIAVDNGINARASVRLAQRLGIDVVVIDHHRIQEQVETTAVWVRCVLRSGPRCDVCVGACAEGSLERFED